MRSMWRANFVSLNKAVNKHITSFNSFTEIMDGGGFHVICTFASCQMQLVEIEKLDLSYLYVCQTTILYKFIVNMPG